MPLNLRGRTQRRKVRAKRVSTTLPVSPRMRRDMPHKITLLPGDGVGPEVAQATCRIIDAAGAAIEWEWITARMDGTRRVGEFPFAEAVESVRRNRVALKGPMATGVAEGAPSIN